MGTDSIIRDIQELQELKRMKDELEAAIEAAAAKVKEDLGDTQTGTYGPFRVTYKEVTSVRVDTTALKNELPDIAAGYSKTYTTRPLKIT